MRLEPPSLKPPLYVSGVPFSVFCFLFGKRETIEGPFLSTSPQNSILNVGVVLYSVHET